VSGPPTPACALLVAPQVGLRPSVGTSHVSKHNLDALFVHGTMQVLGARVLAWVKVAGEGRGWGWPPPV